MSHDTAEETSHGTRWRLPKTYSSLGLIVIIHLAFFSYYQDILFGFIKNFPQRGQNFAFTVSLAAIASVLAVTYFYTYLYFTENFYFYISMGWTANAIYLLTDLNVKNYHLNSSDEFFKYRIGILLLSLVSTAFMLVAVRSPGERGDGRRAWRRTFLLAAVFTLADAAVYFALHKPLTGDKDIILAWLNLGASVISFTIIWRVGESIRARLGDDNIGHKVRYVAAAFYAYALAQFLYPIFHYLTETRRASEHLMLILFMTAQLSKVINAIMIMGVLQATRDREIRQKRATDAVLRETEEKLQIKNQLADLGALTASIKHDVSTPLATMGGHIQRIKDRFQHNKEIVGKMEKLEQSMDRIAAAVYAVDIVRGDETFYNRDKFMMKASMLEVVHRAVRSVKDEKPPALSRTAVKVEGREVYVRAYTPLLEQVVVNVIKNALEAIAEAGRERGLVNIHVHTTQLPESAYSRWVKVEVSDNGCGIPPENIGKLTTLFTTRNDKKPNSGIGLFMGKKIMDIHGGRMRFDSTVGEGTTVTLLLPEWGAFQKAAEEADARPPSEEEEAAPAAPPAEEQGEATRPTKAENLHHSGGVL